MNILLKIHYFRRKTLSPLWTLQNATMHGILWVIQRFKYHPIMVYHACRYGHTHVFTYAERHTNDYNENSLFYIEICCRGDSLESNGIKV